MSVSQSLKKKQAKKLAVIAEQDFSTGNLNQAASTCEKILKKDPGNSNAHRVLGLIYLANNKNNEALKILQAGCQMNPDNALIHSTLGNVLVHMGRTNNAAEVLHRTVILKPENHNYKIKFAQSMCNFRFNTYHQGIKDALVVCLQGDEIDIVCQELMKSCHSLFQVDPVYDYLRNLMQIDTYEKFSQTVDTTRLVKPFSDTLFLLLLKRIIFADPKIEKLYTHLRHYFLSNNISDIDKYLPFLNALACQCYYNEYVFLYSEEEREKVTALEKSWLDSDNSPSDISLLGCYKALHRLPNIDSLIAPINTTKYPSLAELIQLQITEPLEEKEIIRTITSYGEISDKVSKEVLEQYDENPYPRWNSVSTFDLTPAQIKQSQDKDILIAGTGTGREAASAARRFPKAKVLAVDLSLRSLAYGVRKIRNLGINNIDFMQADILELAGLDKQFDLIASSGVLHFMDDPEKALEVLTELVKPCGVLKIGIYSKIARRRHDVYHQYIKENGYDSTIEGMRAFRTDIMENNNNSQTPTDLLGHYDFYSTSMCRDMVFHVHEHAYNLMDIKGMLKKTNLFL